MRLWFGAVTSPPNSPVSQSPKRSLTPAKPRPQAGHPHPKAVVDGSASGKEEHDRKATDSMDASLGGVGYPARGGSGRVRIAITLLIFSGILVNVLISNLRYRSYELT